MKKFSLLFVIALAVVCVIAIAGVAQAATVCSNGTCSYVACTQPSDCGNNYWTGFQTCQSNSIYQNYITYICNNPGTPQSSCTTSMLSTLQQSCGSNVCSLGRCTDASGGTSTGNTGNTGGGSYINQAYKGCVGNTSYWYDSNGTQGSFIQTCSSAQTCTSGNCVNNQTYTPPAYTPPATTCTYHAYLGCSGNSSYWYNSCGTRQALWQNCNDTGQTCSAGHCIGAAQIFVPTPATTVNPTDTTTQNPPIITNTVPANDTAAIAGASESAASSPIIEFLKRWYLWIIVVVVLIALFVIIFRRLSTQN